MTWDVVGAVLGRLGPRQAGATLPTGWGAGDQVAETLVLRAEGADASAGRALRRALGGDPPAREAQWAAMADELWTRLGLRTEFGDLVPGRTVGEGRDAAATFIVMRPIADLALVAEAGPRQEPG